MSAFPFELVLPAFIAGLFTFLAPCTLPLVPGYLAYISGTSSQALTDQRANTRTRRRIILSALAFIIGFSIVFILFGLVASSAGSLLQTHRTLLVRLGGTFLLLFGLSMIGALRIPALTHEHPVRIPPWLRRGGVLPSVLFGAAFAVGWSPCIGPILGTILTIAATSGSESTGILLLASYAMGLAAPFLIIAFSIGSASASIETYLALTTRYKKMILGVVGLLAGFLIATALFSITSVRANALGELLLITLPFIFPLLGATLLIYFGSRSITDPVTYAGGVTIALLGILLALNKLGVFISYSFLILGQWGLGALEEWLMRFL